MLSFSEMLIWFHTFLPIPPLIDILLFINISSFLQVDIFIIGIPVYKNNTIIAKLKKALHL